MFQVTEQEEEIGEGLPYAGLKAFAPLPCSAPEMDTMPVEIRFDAKVEVGNDKNIPPPFDEECWSLAQKFEYHRGLKTSRAGW